MYGYGTTYGTVTIRAVRKNGRDPGVVQHHEFAGRKIVGQRQAPPTEARCNATTWLPTAANMRRT